MKRTDSDLIITQSMQWQNSVSLRHYSDFKWFRELVVILTYEFKIKGEIQQVRNMEGRSDSQYILISNFNNLTDHRHRPFFIQIVAFTSNGIEIDLHYLLISKDFHVYNFT